MRSDRDTFTIEQLRRMIALELTRADTQFIQSQIAARQALGRDLLPEGEVLNVPSLQVDRVDITLSLVAAPPNIWVRIWRWCRAFCSGHAVATQTQFRLAAEGEDATRILCVVSRSDSGRFRAQIMDAAGHA